MLRNTIKDASNAMRKGVFQTKQLVNGTGVIFTLFRHDLRSRCASVRSSSNTGNNISNQIVFDDGDPPDKGSLLECPLHSQDDKTKGLNKVFTAEGSNNGSDVLLKNKSTQTDSVFTGTKKNAAEHFSSWNRPASKTRAPTKFIGAEDGLTTAHHYPTQLLPLALSNRVPTHLYIETPNPKRNFTLLNRLTHSHTYSHPHDVRNKANVVLFYSGKRPHCDITTISSWLTKLKDSVTYSPKNINTMVIRYRSTTRALQWIHRAIFNSLLPIEVKSLDEIVSSFTLVGNINDEASRILHLYNNDLVSALIIDLEGFVRWHCVGTPTTDSILNFDAALSNLCKTRKNTLNVTL